MSGDAAAAAPVGLVLGTMTMGPAVGDAHSKGRELNDLPAYCQTPRDVAARQLRHFADAARCRLPRRVGGAAEGSVVIDTSAAYQNGWTERVLGDILAEDPSLRARVSVHTKAHPGQKPHKCLSYDSVLAQARHSLESLRCDRLDVLYLHRPDPKTPIDGALRAVAELRQHGKIVEFGLSNYPAWAVTDIWHRADRMNGCPVPTIYQGSYNAIARNMEPELWPACRSLGVRMCHFNPLAGGLLTGKYKGLGDTKAQKAGRFGAASPISGAQYSKRYWKEEIFAALDIIRRACAECGVPMLDGALRWALHHSALSGAHGDAVIFGASSFDHLSANVAAAAGGPLPAAAVDAYDAAWARVRPSSEGYFWNYGTAPGASDTYLRTFQTYVPKALL